MNRMEGVGRVVERGEERGRDARRSVVGVYEKRRGSNPN